MIIFRRRGTAVPAAAAAAALLTGVLASAPASAAGGPVEPPPPGAVVVDELAGLFPVAVEVGPRAITWAGLAHADTLVLGTAADPDGGVPPVAASIAQYALGARAYTPDLGKAALSLGEALPAPVPAGRVAAATDEWAVAYDPTVGIAGALLVSHLGGTPTSVEFPDDFGLQHASQGVSVWGDTALVGHVVVNLVTGEATDLGWILAPPCPDDPPAVLADGLLLYSSGCPGADIVGLDVPETGVTQAMLEGDGWCQVVAHPANRLAYSRGLVVFWSSDTRTLGYARLGSSTGPVTMDVPVPVRALRAQGARFVLVAGIEGHEAGLVFEEGRSLDSPVAIVPLGVTATVVAQPAAVGVDGDLAATTVTVPRDPSSDMAGDWAPIDLYGRTLAWVGDDGDLLATTLPPLSTGLVTSSAPVSATPGAAFTVTASGLLPGEEVAVWLESTPVLLASGYAGADGSFSASVTIPASTAGGAHTLTVHGVESGLSSVRTLTLPGAANPGLRIDTGR